MGSVSSPACWRATLCRGRVASRVDAVYHEGGRGAVSPRRMILPSIILPPLVFSTLQLLHSLSLDRGIMYGNPNNNYSFFLRDFRDFMVRKNGRRRFSRQGAKSAKFLSLEQGILTVEIAKCAEGRGDCGK